MPRVSLGLIYDYLFLIIAPLADRNDKFNPIKCGEVCIDAPQNGNSQKHKSWPFLNISYDNFRPLQKFDFGCPKNYTLKKNMFHHLIYANHYYFYSDMSAAFAKYLIYIICFSFPDQLVFFSPPDLIFFSPA